MNSQQFPQVVTHIFKFLYSPLYASYECYSYTILLFTCFWAWRKYMLFLLYLMQSKYAKIQLQEIPTIGFNALEFFFVSLHTEFLSHLYKMFQVASVYDTNVEYQIWVFCCNLFLSYAINRHTHIHTDQTLKMQFLYSEDLIMCKSMKTYNSKIWLKNNTFSTIPSVRESKKTTSLIC